MNILFVSAEAEPFAKTGGLGDVIGSLPKELLNYGVDARVIMPLYQSIKGRFKNSLILINEFFVQLSWRKQYCALYVIDHEGIRFYFIDNDQYFGRERYYGYYDDGERFAFFSKAVLEAMNQMDFQPDVLHCNEWQTALVPVYLKTDYKAMKNYKAIRTVLTIHNIEYQGIFDLNIAGDLFGITDEDRHLIEDQGHINILKGGIVCCDKLTTVSPTYAAELKHHFYARGLEHIIRENESKFYGIINGIDRVLWNPETDPIIAQNYNSRSPNRKKANKLALQEQLGLRLDPDIPIIAMIGRLVAHKGLDMVKSKFDQIMSEDIQFVMLGTGEPEYEQFFIQKAEQYHGRASATIHFSKDLSNKIYASAQFFLMPSMIEPCGIAQMLALRYGTIPIVRETGGLKDSIKAFDPITGEGNGVTFHDYADVEMLAAIKRALTYFRDSNLWKKMVRNAFRSDFSWKMPGLAYIDLYKSLENKEQ
jgi:starch synthase